MKQWNGNTYYWCPANHKHSHWHTHKVEECNTYKKMLNEQNKSVNEDKNEVTVDENKLKKGMAAIFPSGDGNRSRPPVPPLHPDGPRAREFLTDDATTRICVHSRPHRAAPPPRNHRNDTHHTRRPHDERRRLIFAPHKQGTAWTPLDRSFVLVTQSVSTLRVTLQVGPVP